VYSFAVFAATGVTATLPILLKPAKVPQARQAASNSSRYVLERIPASAVHHGHTAAPHMKIAESTSGNWSGYAVPAPSGGSFTDVKGSWTVPSVTGSKNSHTYSSIWVGLDGYNDGTVEQLGTEQDWTGKTGSYYVWFEMYPNYAYKINGFPITPGDQFTAEVTYAGLTNGNQIFTLSIANTSQHVSYTIPASYTTTSGIQLQSAEWIVEAPSSFGGVLPLANFGTASLYGCTANGATVASYSAAGLDPLTMAGVTGRSLYTKAAPSGVDSSGERFTVTWSHQ
jgi:hypothetical protein